MRGLDIFFLHSVYRVNFLEQVPLLVRMMTTTRTTRTTSVAHCCIVSSLLLLLNAARSATGAWTAPAFVPSPSSSSSVGTHRHHRGTFRHSSCHLSTVRTRPKKSSIPVVPAGFTCFTTTKLLEGRFPFTTTEQTHRRRQRRGSHSTSLGMNADSHTRRSEENDNATAAAAGSAGGSALTTAANRSNTVSGGIVSGAILAFATNVASAAATVVVAGEAGGAEMGARLDAPAAVSFGAVFVAFAFLQARIRAAIKARTARREYDGVVKDTEKQQLAGLASEEDVLLVEERMAQLVREEEEARMVDVFGIPFNLVIPDGGAGGSAAPTRGLRQGRPAGGGEGRSGEGGLGIRDAVREKAEADLREGKAREEEMTPMATLKVAALWLVLISQLWLLLVLWNDPMGPATNAFLRD